MKKNFQDRKVEIESTKKIQTKNTLENESLESWMGTFESSLTNRVLEMEDIISGPEGTI